MAKVILGASMSLDGYVSGPEESGFDKLFQWYENGDVTIETRHPTLTFKLTETSAAHFRSMLDNTGALLVGRRLFDITDGWGGEHPLGVRTVVLTHKVPDGWEQDGEHFVFVTEGIEAAVAKAREIAGEKLVGVSAGITGGQALDAGLVDEVWIDLVPVVLGAGVPFFASLAGAPVSLEGPISTEQGNAVTHLKYRVVR
ncbi:dihydrofolate reductase family protein [Crossiella cryophila]|uniref:Dihydrofolate reductase n=1 Tax=Crossiella cryophila TaxID=43355 RepID=A0A7W7CBZ7_9PSEU|nr:dihydrofolate reductase family protein [Crossiella cryophila]MBB4678314.1 dihydrofolate reductase [Crossiella cryophila]